MRVCWKVILALFLLAVFLSGCVTPYRGKQDDLLNRDQYGREAVEYYQVKLSIPF